MFDFEAISRAMSGQTVLCVGDLMLDEFVYGEVSRISPEAPAPVITVRRSETNIGGAGNVARNIAALGGRCIFVGLIGEDAAGTVLAEALAKEAAIETVLVRDAARPTTRKVRFVSEQFSTHMLRSDWELAAPAAPVIEQQLIDAILPRLARADIVLLSDYAKGVLTARVIRNVIDAARQAQRRVIVDPKSANLAIYRGATVLTPNRKEFAEATRSRADSHDSIAQAAPDAMHLADCEAMLVTQGERGMTLVTRGGESIHVPALPVKVRDVSGAGDTVAAALALALAGGADWEGALRIASAAAAVAVGKTGTAIVKSAELRRRILPHASLAAEEKIVPAGGDIDAHLEEWRRQDLRIGFTNGCFDILHPGHVKVLTAARGACDRLVVGLNSDASVKRLKGEGRPVQDERARAEVLAALEAVDLVAIFEEDTPINLITQVRPSVLVKGGDYTREQVVGHEIVEAAGGEVVLVEILAGHSTTSLVARAREGKA
ncbi:MULTISPECIES: D-glycero-beta-D-manno-heptose-7-phosphate kinase [Bradyrhizobium]|jgi:D-beta-D-heptose 7-phosphate kinase / D-beta-D-heptose 1-phosphate adenosyltransferase|uniref:D-glycero-beta-D-manno-heptose-7-phosphate kinase n=1 Tax=Bradyrhizobium TaxID=374 RepID=UPI00048A3D9E|nr:MULTISPECIES: D-glycero-beta-D-manno-heptose-7-phosphate kinase [Bradyrhizobium]MCS3450951.1 D-beta-D-heptose 7-phosphate kinase/D-beta-D-heptose 1-phosphate adenosyltransferase [Bradyrhizobium elkanii]MCS3557904.1 D-beta-D-heptose 7-phosphate kinase/D-beta-D-heptose 1-phosphate adenosyltransferase [Bradyrhizobium elkanii]MCW2152249.1 D-beta-D-heptose 7-phosphate kinase/D-beta-D-heptose 1-phosphate adenosyltransferase [Bradyrhizobium elkanii]MCW2357875.1 D-beta-D-heptose 7-phosphate kinase/D